MIENFTIYTSNKGKGFMTGYYEPELNGYRNKRKGSYPIYLNPKILGMKELSILSRKKINSGALENKGLEIAWVENEIEAFFLHIQGSGRIRYPDNSLQKIRYAGSNKKKYKAIGSVLVREGYLKKKDITMYSIKNWLYKNPKLSTKIMEENERYIFFEKYEGKLKGSQLLELLPNISVAVDQQFIPSGTPLIIQELDKNSHTFLALAHDKGIAIKGQNRIDLFTGFGKQAEKKAAVLKKNIRVWILKPKKY